LIHSEIVNELARYHPRLIDELQLAIREFTRIAILWEEKCAASLKEVHADVHRRAKTMKEEANRIQENATLAQSEKVRLINEKYATIMKPSFVKLERLLRDLSVPPQTPQEKWFQETFGKGT
jgi:PI-3-kinase-related kinase SMG-1